MNLLAERIGTEIAIKNILFATDFSEFSQAALPYVTALSLRYGGTVHVAHVLPDPVRVGLGAPDPAVMGAIYEGVHSAAQEKIQQLAKNLEGYPYKTYIRHGKVAEVVADIVDSEAIDLLVLGTHGRTGLGRLLMGSVAEEVFRVAPIPVLTIGPKVGSDAERIRARHDHNFEPSQIKFRQILYATDLRPEAKHGCKYAVSLAREFRSNLTLLNVIEDYGDRLHEYPKPIDEALGKLRDLLPEEESFRYMPELLARYGSPA